jgi:hypothetical protein
MHCLTRRPMSEGETTLTSRRSLGKPFLVQIIRKENFSREVQIGLASQLYALATDIWKMYHKRFVSIKATSDRRAQILTIFEHLSQRTAYFCDILVIR